MMVSEPLGDPLVSIILPTFNRGNVVEQAIGSVLRQDHRQWELLIVDDGSTDDTQAILAGFNGDSRIRCFRQENRGQASARNLGIRQAHGAWIAFIDSDDRWLPYKLRAQMDYLARHPQTDILYGEAERIDLEGHVLPKRSAIRRHSGLIWRQLLYDNFIGMSTSVVQATKLREVAGFDETMRQVEDYDLWLRLSATCRFAFVPGVVSQYRVGGSRVSDQVVGCADANVAAVERFMTMHPALVSPEEASGVRSRLYGRIAREFAHEGIFGRSLVRALAAVRLAPMDMLAWRTLAAVAVQPLRRFVKGYNPRAD